MEKFAAAIAAWEKKSESKSRSSEPLQQLTPEDVEKLIPAPTLEPAEVQAEEATMDQSESLGGGQRHNGEDE